MGLETARGRGLFQSRPSFSGEGRVLGNDNRLVYGLGGVERSPGFEGGLNVLPGVVFEIVRGRTRSSAGAKLHEHGHGKIKNGVT